jgi:polar amino acid transport system substrate-binding protein
MEIERLRRPFNHEQETFAVNIIVRGVFAASTYDIYGKCLFNVMKTMSFVLILFALIFCSTTGTADEIIHVTNDEWLPYQSSTLKHNGLFAHIVSEAFALVGVRVEHEFFPSARSLELVKYGDFDASTIWSYSPERAEYADFSQEVLWQIEWVFFHLKSYSFNWNTLADLKDIDIGATVGYSYSPEFIQAEKAGHLSVERVPTDVINWRKLLRRRIQIFPNGRVVGVRQLHKYFSLQERQQVTYHPKPLVVKKYYMLFSKKTGKSERLIKLFDEGLRALKKSGKYQQFITDFENGEYEKK